MIQAKLQDRIAILALSQIKGIGYRRLLQLSQYFNGIQNIFDIKNSKKINKINYFKNIEFDVNLKKTRDFYEASKDNNIDIITFVDKKYPKNLKNIHNPPIVIYSKGNLNIDDYKVISIIGSRKSTKYGKDFMEELIRSFVGKNIAVCSGLAAGTDVFAHKKCLEYNIPTIAVLPSPINDIYPKRHTPVANDIISSNGLVISEYSPNSVMDVTNFPLRNRITAGIADCTIVIEAGLKSGSLITANFANDFNRDVFALPGDIYSSNSLGCNNLIKNHLANMITEPKDLFDIMRWDSNKKANYKKETPKHLTDKERHIFEYLNNINKPTHISDIAKDIDMPFHALHSTVLNLEMNGLVLSDPGDNFSISRH